MRREKDEERKTKTTKNEVEKSGICRRVTRSKAEAGKCVPREVCRKTRIEIKRPRATVCERWAEGGEKRRRHQSERGETERRRKRR